MGGGGERGGGRGRHRGEGRRKRRKRRRRKGRGRLYTRMKKESGGKKSNGERREEVKTEHRCEAEPFIFLGLRFTC